MSTLTRRQALKASAFTAFGVSAFATTGLSGAFLSTASAAVTPRFTGHQPGKIYLGMSVGGDLSTALAKTGPVGVYRSFYKWGDATREDKTIKADHAAGRLPWVSFKPPTSEAGIWKLIAQGNYDADIRARARRYAGFSKPIIVTFNHEPQTDMNLGPAGDWAAAWVRIYDVMMSETGLKNVEFAPIIGDWVFNPVNRKDDPSYYLTSEVLSRMKLLGIDIYQNASGEAYEQRLGRIIAWLDARGASHIMVGVGETGATEAFTKSAVSWWNESWAWAQAHTDRVGIVSYFNSTNNSKSFANWSLDESLAKLNAYKAALGTSVVTKLL